MISQFEKLPVKEKELLLKAPALISVFVSSSLNEVNAARKADAIKLAHLKTFTASPLLIPYYIEVEKNFKEKFESIVKQYTPLDKEKRDELKKEIDSCYLIAEKVDKFYGHALQLSFNRYAKHVQHGDRPLLEYFIFPYPVPGFTD